MSVQAIRVQGTDSWPNRSCLSNSASVIVLTAGANDAVAHVRNHPLAVGRQGKVGDTSLGSISFAVIQRMVASKHT